MLLLLIVRQIKASTPDPAKNGTDFFACPVIFFTDVSTNRGHLLSLIFNLSYLKDQIAVGWHRPHIFIYDHLKLINRFS